MSCLEIHNSINGAARISFSNDFAEIRSESSTNANNINTRSSISNSKPPSVDFEFSVTDYSMIPADEIFLKGKILPFKETSHVRRTLREELLVKEEGFSLRPMLLSSSPFSTKGTWKELLGLKRTHVRSKKNEEEICSLGQDHKTMSGNVSMKECQVADK